MQNIRDFADTIQMEFAISDIRRVGTLSVMGQILNLFAQRNFVI